MIFLNTAVACLYLLSVLGYFLQTIVSDRRPGCWALFCLKLGVVLQTIFVGIQVYETAYPFILNQGEFYYISSWAVALAFLVLRRRYRLWRWGAFFSPLVLLLFVWSEISKKEFHFGAGVAGNPWALVHLTFMSLAFAIFAVSFLIGLLYLVQQFQLKQRHLGRFLDWFPSLETVDLMHYRALTVGFFLLSIGLFSGAILSKTTSGYFLTGDPRQMVSIGTWALYALFLNVRLKAGWRGRRGIILSLLGFVGVVFAFVALEHRM